MVWYQLLYATNDAAGNAPCGSFDRVTRNRRIYLYATVVWYGTMMGVREWFETKPQPRLSFSIASGVASSVTGVVSVCTGRSNAHCFVASNSLWYGTK